MVNLLADYAQFAGVGVSTTMGMGRVRRLARDEQESIQNRQLKVDGDVRSQTREARE